MKVPARFLAAGIGQRHCSWSLLSRVCVLFLFALWLCGSVSKAQDAVVLVGSGSSVPAPLYNRWAQEYGKRNPKIQMRYLPVGTSEGIKEISRGAGDFGAGEAQLTETQRKEGGLIERCCVAMSSICWRRTGDYR